jgi:O-acetyl-ADP-ribose deacetylase (regulator of RNase III)
MKEITGDIFTFDVICVPTNGVVKSNGCLVMGAGFARECAERWPELPQEFGKLVKTYGNVPHVVNTMTSMILKLGNRTIISFPTKHDFSKPSSLSLIKESAEKLVQTADIMSYQTVALPRVGCGLGGLDWESQVKPHLQKILDDRFVIMTP